MHHVLFIVVFLMLSNEIEEYKKEEEVVIRIATLVMECSLHERLSFYADSIYVCKEKDIM